MTPLPTIPATALGIGAILAILLTAWWDKRRKDKAEVKEDAKILHTAPDDPVGVANIDAIERVQEPAASKPRPE